ncbi:MAG: hypothetical protein K1X79_01745 [Oligoflexia bacterium]|nr:hypothetical protein [Oligoflexia bacterium]
MSYVMVADRAYVRFAHTMDFNIRNTLIACLRTVLRPVLQFCLRWSLTIQDLLESAKVVFLEVAADEIRRQGKEPNVSRLSVMTGLRRREVMRIWRDQDEKSSSFGLITRVIGMWQQSKRFQGKNGKPRVLSLDGENSEFNRLVQSISTDLHPGTVLFELERLQLVTRSEDGLLLKVESYFPKADPKEAFTMLAHDTADLISAAEENILGSKKRQNLHLTTEYDNIRIDELPQIEQWFLEEGKKIHERARQFLSKFDQSLNPKRGADAGARVVLGTFSRTQAKK